MEPKMTDPYYLYLLPKSVPVRFFLLNPLAISPYKIATCQYFSCRYRILSRFIQYRIFLLQKPVHSSQVLSHIRHFHSNFNAVCAGSIIRVSDRY